MTIDETKQILSILKIAYPNFYKDLKAEEANQIVSLWSSMFADDNSKIVTEAVKALMCTLKFPPTIADVKEKIHSITHPKQQTELEAWGFVLKAIRNSAYNSQDEFNKLPSIVQKILGGPSQLREWASMDSDVVNSVIQSNFMRSYTARSRIETENEKLPQSTKELMLGLSEKFKMIGE